VFKTIWRLLRALFGQSDGSLERQPDRTGHKPSLVQPPMTPAKPRPTPSAPPRVPLYSARRFDCDAIRAAASSDLNGRERRPTDAQLGLIFSEAGAQSVVAGAGAGKSTSLVSRFLVMNKHLELPLQSISVFTFTRNSRFDFVDKLVEAAAAWGIENLDKGEALRRVRTFHSKALELTAGSLPRGVQLFEQLGKVQKPRPGSDDEALYLAKQAELADQVDNPYESTQSTQQVEILREVYELCYRASPSFRKAISALLKHALRTPSQRPLRVSEDYEKRTWAAARDAALTAHAQEYWTVKGAWPVEGVELPPGNLTVGGQVFRANGWIRSLDVYVVLGCDSTQDTKVTAGGRSFIPYWSGSSKHNVLLKDSTLSVFFANDLEHFAELNELLRAADAAKKDAPPVFKVALPGEWKKVSVFEGLYALGVFAENMAIEPSRLPVSELGKRLTPLEQQTLVAVCEFFKTFRDYGSANGVRTFNELFFMLHEGSPHLATVALNKLRSMQHLLIDEFQDISPLVVKFVQGIHTQLATLLPQEERPSLLVVGDDWQSIYGWRGSAPHFFIHFAKLFDGANRKPVMLTDNFRSSQNVIDAASLLIKGTASAQRIDKACVAKHPRYAGGTHPLWLIEDYRPGDAFKLISKLLSLAKADEEILVLSRSGSTDREMERQCRRLSAGKRLRTMTIHRSKGLEADYVLVLDDIHYGGKNDLRNALYAHAGFNQTYDDSQKDEARRIGYVAVTRAKQLSVWIAKPRDGGVLNEVTNLPGVVRRADMGQLMRELG
jgi:superfamily I DNA/RNA helicase